MTDAMHFESSKNTVLHVISIETGENISIDTGLFFQLIHTGNSYMRKDGILVVDATIYCDKQKNVYDVFMFQKLKNEKDMLKHDWGNSWKRFEIDL